MNKYLEKFVRIFTDILLGLIIIAILFVLYGYYQKDVQKKGYVNYFGYTLFEVVSGSMGDTIKVNDIIVVKIGTNDLAVNDIITYEVENSYVTHRILSIKGDKIVAKGDANNSFDKAITKDTVIGKVVYKVSNLKIWRNVFFTPKVFMSIAVTLGLFISYFKIRNYQGTKKDNESDNNEKN